jgi:tRNA A37 threonylcarbamoyladenosine dehydratase
MQQHDVNTQHDVDTQQTRDYQRQETLNLSIPDAALIVGCGGTGVWTALALLLVGVRKFVLVDEDDIATHNLNRLPYHPASVGRSKAFALSMLLKSIEPSVSIVEHWKMLEFNSEWSMMSKLAKKAVDNFVVVDCTDDIKFQQTLYAECIKQNLQYYRVGCTSDGYFAGTKVPTGAFASDMQQGYGQPSWVAPPMMAAAMGVDLITKGPFSCPKLIAQEEPINDEPTVV